jgi:hypothetical protein
MALTAADVRVEASLVGLGAKSLYLNFVLQERQAAL